MAEIIGGGEPVNDSERAVIRHLRDHGPAALGRAAQLRTAAAGQP